jgi:hypothetical protein
MTMKGDAIISPCETYRYTLTRIWDDTLPRTCFVCLNPSTADASINDPTCNYCIKLVKHWGHGSIVIVNLFAFRASKPEVMRRFEGDVIGPSNDEHIFAQAQQSDLVICAWGNNGVHNLRNIEVKEMLLRCDKPLHHLGLTASNHPVHPMYLSYNGILKNPEVWV